MSTSPLSPLSLYFPIHDPCFGDPSNSSSVCQVPTNEMIAFLNISNPTAYLEAYCLNPPIDSCAFGYCSNPDVASPAVRISSAYSRCLDSKMTHYTVSLYHDDCLGNPRTIFPRRRPSLSTCDSRLIQMAESLIRKMAVLFTTAQCILPHNCRYNCNCPP